jgi:membrane protein
MNFINTAVKKVDRFQQRHRPLAFIYAVIKKYGDDGAGYQAALLTYYGFLALFPLLLVLTTVTDSLIGKNPELAGTVIKGLTDYFPLLGNQLASRVHGLNSSGWPLIAGLLFALYGTRGVADVFQLGVRKIWGIPASQRDGFPKAQLKSLAIVIVGGFGFIVASILAGISAAAAPGPAPDVLSTFLNLFVLFWLFVFLLNFSLPRHVSFKDTRLAAAVAAIGLVTLQLVGGYILTHELKSLDALYSYFAIALGLLFWIYLQSQMLFYAVEIAAVKSQKKWPRSLNEPTADKN